MVIKVSIQNHTTYILRTKKSLSISLLTMEVKHLTFFYISLQSVVDMNRNSTHRTACIDKVASLEGEEPTDITNDFIHLIDHIARTSFLLRLSIDIKMKPESLNI